MRCCDMRMKENKIMKMISRLRRLLQLHCCFLYRRFLCSFFCSCF